MAVRILAVGIGGYANVWLEAMLARGGDAEIVGAVDPYPQGCKFYDTLTERGVPIFSEIEEFYARNSADLAVITTPIHLHTRQILTALSHGSSVLCEKPLSGVSADEALLNEAARRAGKFIMIGYQWSYSEAITRLKRDILDGKYGAPVSMKTIVLWPRPQEYFTRGTGWGGKLTAPDGTVINDSVANNAAAHYLHNMLYLLGDAPNTSAEAQVTSCKLSRVNRIENFDTVDLQFTAAGCRCRFLASHVTEHLLDPTFCYRFEKGEVTFGDGQANIIGRFSDGTAVDYGDPFDDINRKLWIAIENVRKNDPEILCGVSTAAAHVRCIEALQRYPVSDVPAEQISCRDGGFLFVPGLYEELTGQYREFPNGGAL